MKNTLLIAAIIGAGIVIYFFVKQVTTESHQVDSPSSVVQIAHSAQQEDISSASYVTLPRTAISAPSTSNSSLSSPDKSAQSTNENPSVTVTAPSEPQATEDRDVEIQKILNFMEGKSNKSIADTMRLKFENEMTDYEWSSTYEHKVHDFFKESPVFSNFSPTEITCKSSYCRVVVIATDGAQTEEASKAIMASMSKSSLGSPNKSLFVVNEAAGQIEFYLARDEESQLY